MPASLLNRQPFCDSHLLREMWREFNYTRFAVIRCWESINYGSTLTWAHKNKKRKQIRGQNGHKAVEAAVRSSKWKKYCERATCARPICTDNIIANLSIYCHVYKHRICVVGCWKIIKNYIRNIGTDWKLRNTVKQIHLQNNVPNSTDYLWLRFRDICFRNFWLFLWNPNILI